MNVGTAVRLLGAVARVNRLIVADDVPGKWWIKDPIDTAMHRYRDRKQVPIHVDSAPAFRPVGGQLGRSVFHEPWWWKYRQGLDCPWCVSMHVGVAMVAVESVLPDRGIVRTVWNVVTAGLALSEISTNVGLALGDFYEGDD